MSYRPVEGRVFVLLLILLAIVAIIAFGVGFTAHWLFIIAAIAALIFLVSLFAGGIGGRSRTTWW
jgi:hypothetical protein